MTADHVSRATPLTAPLTQETIDVLISSPVSSHPFIELTLITIITPY